MVDPPRSSYGDWWEQIQKLFCQSLLNDCLTGAWVCYLRQLHGGTAATRRHQTALVWILLEIWNFVYPLNVASNCGKQVRAEQVCKGGEKSQVSALPALACSVARNRSEVRWMPHCVPNHDPRSENMKYGAGGTCLLTGQGGKLQAR